MNESLEKSKNVVYNKHASAHVDVLSWVYHKKLKNKLNAVVSSYRGKECKAKLCVQ